jgi:Homoserine dehydrogenase
VSVSAHGRVPRTQCAHDAKTTGSALSIHSFTLATARRTRSGTSPAEGRADRSSADCEILTPEHPGSRSSIRFITGACRSRTHPADAASLTARVEPALVPNDDRLAEVSGVGNAVVCRAEPVGDVMVTGPGAGLELAGQGVLSDLIAVARSSRYRSRATQARIATLSATFRRLQFRQQSHPAHIPQERRKLPAGPGNPRPGPGPTALL